MRTIGFFVIFFAAVLAGGAVAQDKDALLEQIRSLGLEDPHTDSARRGARQSREAASDEEHEDLMQHPLELLDEHPEDTSAKQHGHVAPTKAHRKESLKHSLRHPAGARAIRERLQATYCEPAGTGRRDYTEVVSTREQSNEGSDEGRFPEHATSEMQKGVSDAMRGSRETVVAAGVSIILAQTQVVFRHGDRAGMVTTPGAKPARWNCTMPIEPNLDKARLWTASAHASHHPHKMDSEEEGEAVNSAVIFQRYRATYNDEMCAELGLMGPARAGPPLPPGWGDPLGEALGQADAADEATEALDSARMAADQTDRHWTEGLAVAEDGTQLADATAPVAGPLADDPVDPDDQPPAAQIELRDPGQRAASRLMQQLGYPVAKRCGAVAAGRSRSMPEPARRGLEAAHYEGDCVGGQLTPHGMMQAVEVGHMMRMQYQGSNGVFAMGGSFVEPIHVQKQSPRPHKGTLGTRSPEEYAEQERESRSRSDEPQTMQLFPTHPLVRHCFYPGEVSLASTNFGRTAMTVAAVSHGMYPTDCSGPKNVTGAPGGPEEQGHKERHPGLSASASRLLYALHPENDEQENVNPEGDWQDDRNYHIEEMAEKRAQEREEQGLPPLSDEEEQKARDKDGKFFYGDPMRPSANRPGDVWDGSYPSRFISVVPRTVDPFLLAKRHDRCPAARAIADALEHSRNELHRQHGAPLVDGLRRIAKLGRVPERVAVSAHTTELADDVMTRLCHNYPLPCAQGYSDGLPRSLHLQRSPKKASQRRALAMANDYPCLRNDEVKALLERANHAYSDYYDGPDTPLLMEKAARAMLRQSQRRGAELLARAALGADNEKEAASQPIGPPAGDLQRAEERMLEAGEDFRTAMYLAADGPMDAKELAQAETLGKDLLEHFDGDALLRRVRRGSSLPRNMSVDDARAWLGLRPPGALVEHKVGKAKSPLHKRASEALPGIFLPEAVQPHVILRAAHDTVIYPLLATLGYHPAKHPGYLSRLTMETWRAGSVVRGKKGTGKGTWTAGRADLRAGEIYLRFLWDGIDITPHLPCARDTARILRAMGSAARVEDSRAESIAMGHDNHRDNRNIHDATVHQEDEYLGDQETGNDGSDGRREPFGGSDPTLENEDDEDGDVTDGDEEADGEMDEAEASPARIKSRAERELQELKENEKLAWAKHVAAHSTLARHSEWPKRNTSNGTPFEVTPREVLERLQKLARRTMAAAGFCLASTVEAHLDRQLMIGALAGEEAKARVARARKASAKVEEAPLSFADEQVGPNESVDDHLQARLVKARHRLAREKGSWYAACGLHSPPLEPAEELDAIAKSRVKSIPVGGDLDIRDERTAAMPPVHGHRLADSEPQVHPAFSIVHDEDGMGGEEAGASSEESV